MKSYLHKFVVTYSMCNNKHAAMCNIFLEMMIMMTTRMMMTLDVVIISYNKWWNKSFSSSATTSHVFFFPLQISISIHIHTLVGKEGISGHNTYACCRETKLWESQRTKCIITDWEMWCYMNVFSWNTLHLHWQQLFVGDSSNSKSLVIRNFNNLVWSIWIDLFHTHIYGVY